MIRSRQSANSVELIARLHGKLYFAILGVFPGGGVGGRESSGRVYSRVPLCGIMCNSFFAFRFLLPFDIPPPEMPTNDYSYREYDACEATAHD